MRDRGCALLWMPWSLAGAGLCVEGHRPAKRQNTGGVVPRPSASQAVAASLWTPHVSKPRDVTPQLSHHLRVDTREAGVQGRSPQAAGEIRCRCVEGTRVFVRLLAWAQT